MSQRFTQLVIFTTDAEEVGSLRTLFSACPNIVIERGTGPEVSRRQSLDALWISPMQAAYFGISNPPSFGRAMISNTPAAHRAKGLPARMIVGVALDPMLEHPPAYKAKIPAQALAKAIAEYNEMNPYRPLLRVGSVPENLAFDSEFRADAILAVKTAVGNLADPNGSISSQIVLQRA